MACLNLNRFHAIVFIAWQFALIFSLQNLFPIFSNFVPRWRCLNRNSTLDEEFTNDCKLFEECPKEFLHFEEVFYSTALEFGWVCTESAKLYTWGLSTLQFFGVFIGTAIFGTLADKLGRKPVSIFVLSFGISMLALSGFSIEWWHFFVARFFVGLANGGGLVVMYPYCMELILPEQRMALEVYVNWGAARVILTIICYVFPHWRHATFVSCFASLPALIIIFFVFPESPIFLLTKNKIEKMKKSHKKISVISGEVYIDTPQIEQPEKVPLKSLWGSKKVFLVFLILCHSWFTVSISAFAIDLNSPSLYGNFWLNQFLFACVLACSKYVLGLVDHFVPQFNRRILHNYTQFVAAACFAAITTLLILNEETFAILVLSVLGLLAIEYTWDGCYLITVECMPTSIRSTVLGLCSTMARVGALVAPVLVTLSTFWKPSVYLTLTIFGFVNFVLAWNFLPETKGVNLSEVNLKQKPKTLPIDAAA